jgi:hypothetical protein
MDRPQHRRTLLVALVLLAGAALLFLGRQWKSEPERLVAEPSCPSSKRPSRKPPTSRPREAQQTRTHLPHQPLRLPRPQPAFAVVSSMLSLVCRCLSSKFG